jgi:hypothetical protein
MGYFCGLNPYWCGPNLDNWSDKTGFGLLLFFGSIIHLAFVGLRVVLAGPPAGRRCCRPEPGAPNPPHVGCVKNKPSSENAKSKLVTSHANIHSLSPVPPLDDLDHGERRVDGAGQHTGSRKAL